MILPSTLSLSTVSRAACRLAALVLMAIGLAGCYNVDTTVTFKADGTAAMTGRLDFPRDAVYVAEFYKAIMALQPATKQYFDEGLCHSVEKLAALNPHQNFDLKTREYTTDARFGCGFLHEAGDSAALVDKLRQALGGGDSVLSIEQLAPRRARIELDFNKMPDFSQMLPGLIMLGAMQYGGPNQGLPDMAAVDRISKAYADAALAMARMSAPNNHVQLAIKARRVIETNGIKEGDLVRFRWSWEEFVRLMVKPSKGRSEAKVYFAIIDY